MICRHYVVSMLFQYIVSTLSVHCQCLLVSFLPSVSRIRRMYSDHDEIQKNMQWKLQRNMFWSLLLTFGTRINIYVSSVTNTADVHPPLRVRAFDCILQTRASGGMSRTHRMGSRIRGPCAGETEGSSISSLTRSRGEGTVFGNRRRSIPACARASPDECTRLALLGVCTGTAV